MSKLRPLCALPVLLLLAACSTGTPSPSSAPTASPAASPSASPDGATVDHATGATDLVLRMETGGGFVAPSFLVTQAPSFSLYGDGTLIARDETAPWPDPGPSGVSAVPPFHRTTLSEAQVQELLRVALREGGLGVARPRYDSAGIADAPTTIFTVKAGGLDKTVSVYALGFDPPDGQDAAIRGALAALADRLRAAAAALPPTAEPYVPDRWRGVLMDGGTGPASAPVAWPWPDLAPDDFVPAGAGGAGFPRHVLTAEEVGALGLGDLGGGVQNVALVGPDGHTGYSLGLRPLFPDEQG
jgi:hypothetical protein